MFSNFPYLLNFDPLQYQLSPSIETGCSEVSTTVTLLDGNIGACKDEVSRSTTTSPYIDNSKQCEKNTIDSDAKDTNEEKVDTIKLQEKRELETEQKLKMREEVIDIEEENPIANKEKASKTKRYDYLGLYSNRSESLDHSNTQVNSFTSTNNNRKTHNSKVRECKGCKIFIL